MNSLCTHPNCWIKHVKSCYPRFCNSASEQTVEAPESREELDELLSGFAAVSSTQAENSSTLVPKKENICEDAMCKMASGMSFQGASL